jgi:hypothetical protein
MEPEWQLGMVRAYRQSRAVSVSQIELLRIAAKKAEVLAKIGAEGEMARANIAEIMATLGLIGGGSPWPAVRPRDLRPFPARS